MDSQLQELIEAIKTEGVQTAEKQADQIVASAEERAEQIVQDARKRAEEIVEAARKEQAKLDQSGREKLKQAARDLMLSVQSQLVATFKRVVNMASKEAVSADILENAIVTVVNAWSRGESEPVDVLLNPQDLERLEQRLQSRLADHIASGAEIRPSSGVSSGFRVSTKDGSAYYDFTVESIAEALGAYVGPRLLAALKEASSDAASAQSGQAQSS
jgi:V/A-type H+-transporting ATPase subunit E